MNLKSKNRVSVQWDITCSTIFDYLFLLLLAALQSSPSHYLEAFQSRKAQVGVFFYTRPFSIEKKSASIANIIFAMIFMQRYFCNDIEQHLFQTNGKHSKWMNSSSHLRHRWLRRFSDFRLPSYSWANWPVLNNEVNLFIMWINPSSKINCITN